MSETIKLQTVTCTAYGIIDALLCAERAQGKLIEYRKGAAGMVYDLATIVIWGKDPDLLPAEVLGLFNQQFAEAISAHIANKNLGPDYEKKNKNMIQAFQKVSNALQKGIDIRELGSANACEKRVTELNKAREAKEDLKAMDDQAETLAKKKGISKTEAMERLKEAGMVKGDASKSSNDSNTERAAPKDLSTVLQDELGNEVSQPLFDVMLKQMKGILEIGATNEQQAEDMLIAFGDKVDKALQSLGMTKNLFKKSA